MIYPGNKAPIFHSLQLQLLARPTNNFRKNNHFTKLSLSVSFGLLNRMKFWKVELPTFSKKFKETVNKMSLKDFFYDQILFKV